MKNASTVLLWAALTALAGRASAIPPPLGALTQLSGLDACISDDGTGGACTDGNALAADGYGVIALSPDGKNVYSASQHGVAVLSRDPASGVLTQLPGSAGCVAEDPMATPGCTAGRGLEGATSVAVSADGRNVYLTGQNSDSVAAFSRDTSTGALTQLPGTSGCISEDGFDHPGGTAGSCVDGRGLSGVRSVQVSADGANVYVASSFGNSIAAFSRDASTGALTQLSGTDGCVSEDGFDHTGGTAGSCADGVALAGPRQITLSPDDKFAYVASNNNGAIAIFSRDAPLGALTQLPGTAGCVSASGSGGACSEGNGLTFVAHVGISPDGANAYVASGGGSGTVTIFARDPAAGTLTQLAGPAGCIAEAPAPPGCATGKALARANWAVVSPDGLSVYVVSIDPVSAVAVFSRDPADGKISQLPGTAGCVSETGTGGQCADGVALIAVSSLVVSADNATAYTRADGSSAVSAFSREVAPICANVSSLVPNGTRTMIALSCNDPNGDPITRSIVAAPMHGTLESIDEASGAVAYTPAAGFDGDDSFTFAATDGSASSATATASLTVACPAIGADGALCVLRGYPPAACKSDSIPAAIGARVDAARTVLEKAQAAAAAKARKRLLAKSRGKLKKAAKSARKAGRKGSIGPDCATAIDQLLKDAASRAR
ncbi:MAG TPA: beta-propeller fold lactonase family protein [Candidatus Eisenbacteria bacterium]|nr:beta-propeller fold lactonase family protein [Candidatus Eisenbacteria bacterium]